MDKKRAEIFKVLSVDTRIRIIEILKQKGPLGANEMSEMLGITPSAVSQHLKILKHAGLVRNERKGYWIPYDIDPGALEKCGEFLSQFVLAAVKGPESFARRKSIKLKTAIAAAAACPNLKRLQNLKAGESEV